MRCKSLLVLSSHVSCILVMMIKRAPAGGAILKILWNSKSSKYAQLCLLDSRVLIQRESPSDEPPDSMMDPRAYKLRMQNSSSCCPGEVAGILALNSEGFIEMAAATRVLLLLVMIPICSCMKQPPIPSAAPSAAPSPLASPPPQESPSPPPPEESASPQSPPQPPPPPPPEVLQPLTFCSRAVARRTCPNPPTFDYIQLPDYAGKWYEIGATATLKLVTEAGSICNQANYTLPATFTFGQPPNMSVSNTGLHVAGPLTSLGVQQIAAAAAGACSGARSICDRVSNDSRATKATLELGAVAEVIQQADPKAASELREIQSRASGAMGELDATLNLFSSTMERIQRLNGELSQAELLVSNATAAASSLNATVQEQLSRLDNLQGLLDQANALVDSVKQSVGKMKECTPALVKISAQLLVAGDLESSVRLTAASTDMSMGGDAILAQATGMHVTLKGVAAARGLIGLATSSTTTSSNSSTMPSFDSVAGYAIQNVTSPGKLQLQLTPSMASPVPAPAAPYWVLSLRGRAMQGYRAALVYSCSQNEVTGALHQGMFILSRTPRLPKKMLEDFLGLASAFGINTDCDDPFLLTVHHGRKCGIPPPK